MLDTFTKEFRLGEKVPPAQYSPLALAYLGDCVYELFVRTYLLRDANFPVKMLHKSAVKLVNAKAQSDLYQKIKDILTEEENAVYKRGRNTNSHPPKNQDMVDYKSATGVEALIGYLYLKGESDRILELLRYLVEK
ncbi:MAG: ribonuclease III [Ruminococcaceae bacterium]|nr:ribonuclease III [Oscillospiraceae bacterium]